MSPKLMVTVALVLGIGLLVVIGPSVASSSAGVGNCYSAQASSTPTLCD